MAAQQSSGQQDNSMGILWGIAAILFVLAIIWITFKAQILGFFLQVKLWEARHIMPLFSRHSAEAIRTLSDMLQTPVDSIQFGDVLVIGETVGDAVRYVVIPLVLVMAVCIYLSSSTRVFKKVYGMRDLVQVEKINWPQIMPISGLDLVKTDIDKGAWAMALTPMQFCKRHDLVLEHRKGKREGVPRKEWGRIDVSLKREKASAIFAIQLGPVWPGPFACPPHVRALFAAFAARTNADTDAATGIFARLNRSSNGKPDFTGVDDVLKKHMDTPIVRQVVNSHAYLLTVMAEMLVAARNDGVQATADFLWLKPADRRLWYMLNTVGRQTPFVEVAGPFAHWKAEKEAGHRLLLPMVEEASRALELSLKDIIYRPDQKDE